VGAVFGDNQRLRFGKIEHLPRGVAGGRWPPLRSGHRRIPRRSRGNGRW
jgi:hypothetical protein